jgi:hypothetical protein
MNIEGQRIAVNLGHSFAPDGNDLHAAAVVSGFETRFLDSAEEETDGVAIRPPLLVWARTLQSQYMV